ncbi:MAG: LptF/LptG family permease [Reichenbachiella sp.]
MKKLDKLILQSFFGPFILTFLVAVFILLIQYMLKYFDDFIGKNLGIGVFGELMLYFSINMVPMALPLAVLVSSLMTYGKLGEHFELTAIKSAGISLVRVLLPTFVFVVLLAIGAFFFNNRVVPYANLHAYSLLYDIKHTKPALDLKEGQFYGGLPDYSIKVKKKFPDGIGMKDIVIYDHTNSSGNMKVIVADSCRMYTFINDRYLMMELYRGNYYLEEEDKSKKKKKKRGQVKINRFVRTNFDKMDIVFSLASFDMNDTDKNLFSGNRYMKSVGKLALSIDSMEMEKKAAHFKLFANLSSLYKLHQGGYIELSEELKSDEMLNYSKRNEIDSASLVPSDSIGSLASNPKKDSVATKPTPKYSPQAMKSMALENKGNNLTSSEYLYYRSKKKEKKKGVDSLFISDESFEKVKSHIDSLYMSKEFMLDAYTKATANARTVKSSITSTISRFGYFQRSIDAHTVEKFKKYAQAFSCIVMFLIGAPLGSIIKRGGLGLPVIIGIFFFVIFYVLTSVSDKWAKAGDLGGFYAAWVANTILLPPGLFFLKQARKDAKLFDADFYNVWIDKLKTWWEKRQKKSQTK